MKKPLVVVLAALTLALAGCADSDADSLSETSKPAERSAWVQPLPDGREVVCVAVSTGVRNVGLSCDWETAK